MSIRTHTILLLFLTLCMVAYLSCKEDVVPLQDNWEKAIPQQEIPQGLISLSAEHCGECHKDYYEEWRISTHARAWTDLQFQEEIEKDNSPYLCLNCHIPLQNQQENIVSGLVNGDVFQPVKEVNLLFDKKLQSEGITCASCHVRDGVIIGTTGSSNAPHPVRKDSVFLSETMCISCHNANAVVNQELVCTFETGDEWKTSPYYPDQSCINCHMDTISRSLMAEFPVRASRRHWFPGSGIPKRYDIEVKGLSGMMFFPDTLQRFIESGDSIKYQLTLQNQEAGHRLPTGDPERYYLIHLSIIEESGDTTAFQQFRIGEKWEWFPEAKKLADNNLFPDEKRSYSIKYLPEGKGRYEIRSLVTKHRMTEETAAYHGLLDDYPTMIKVYEENQIVYVK